MEKIKKVQLKAGKEKAIKMGHHWIFSGAIDVFPQSAAGDILPVYSAKEEFLGYGYFNKAQSISGRMLSFEEGDPKVVVRRHLREAKSLRDQFIAKDTTAFRVINGEGDLLPGLVVDKYGDTLVLQISTVGIDRLKNLIVDELKQLYAPKAIVEKSTSSSRKEEKLSPQQAVLFGDAEDEVEIYENGLKFVVDIAKGQKTGFFLDQREMRAKVGTLASGKKVLNAFSYTGGFSVYALAGGAKHVDSVDISKEALEICKKNCALNGFKETMHKEIPEDVFQFLRNNALDYELVILDPPAFTKHAKDIIPACRGYKDINRLAMSKMPKGSLLLTASCSHFITEELFQKVLFQAAVEAKRTVKIIGRHQLAPDHPINLCHPEGEYLKSFLLYIE